MKRLPAPEDMVGTLILVVIFGVTIAAVIFRYLLNNSLLWSEEVGRLGLIGITFCGIATGFRRGTHVAVDVSDWFGKSIGTVLRIFCLLVSCAFLAFLLAKSWELSRVLTFSFTAALGIPLAWIYLAIAVAAALGLMRAIMLLVEIARGAAR